MHSSICSIMLKNASQSYMKFQHQFYISLLMTNMYMEVHIQVCVSYSPTFRIGDILYTLSLSKLTCIQNIGHLDTYMYMYMYCTYM